MAVDWSYYNRFDWLIDKYMPMRGEGETKASQTVTAINKLIYKWYNDGDVFDNTYYLKGWCNDLSSYANWLDQKVEGASEILAGLADCNKDEDYEDLLKVLADKFLKEDVLEAMDKYPKEGSIYKCEGKYKWEEPEEEDDDGEWWIPEWEKEEDEESEWDDDTDEE